MTAAPGLGDWWSMWGLWDVVSLEMIPEGGHHHQPLALRHPFVFYLGHLPAFTDRRLAQVTAEPLTEPTAFADLFARGIDPDLDDPSKCHAHSPAPPEWPDMADILMYRDAVRQRVTQLYSRHAAVSCMPPELQHALFLTFEHEAMHLETFTYMLLQDDSCRPPPSHALPQPELSSKTVAVAAAAAALAGRGDGGSHQQQQQHPLQAGCPLPPAARIVLVPGGEVSDGLCPPQQLVASLAGAVSPGTTDAASTASQPASDSSDSGDVCLFGWDNEMPRRSFSVAGIKVQHRPVCVLEFLWFLAQQARGAGNSLCPQDPAEGSSSTSTTSSSSRDGSAGCSSLLQLLSRLFRPPGPLHQLVPLSLAFSECGCDGHAPAASAATHPAVEAAAGEVFAALQQLFTVKTVFGPVPVSVAGLWPAHASAQQAMQYAHWWDATQQQAGSQQQQGVTAAAGAGWRLPTEPEWLLARQYGRACRPTTADAVTGARSGSCSPGSRGTLPWHPMDVELLASQEPGQLTGELGNSPSAWLSQLGGNGWEWTSTVFERHPGFQADGLYPDYSSDFFDGKHLVLRGSSWVTLDSINNRGSFRNFFQAGQAHVFSTFRLVCS